MLLWTELCLKLEMKICKIGDEVILLGKDKK